MIQQYDRLSNIPLRQVLWQSILLSISFIIKIARDFVSFLFVLDLCYAVRVQSTHKYIKYKIQILLLLKAVKKEEGLEAFLTDVFLEDVRQEGFFVFGLVNARSHISLHGNRKVLHERRWRILQA